MSLLIILGLTLAWFSFIGRAAIPASERLPIHEWGPRDLAANFLRGLNLCTKNDPARDYFTGTKNKHD